MKNMIKLVSSLLLLYPFNLVVAQTANNPMPANF